MDTPLSAVNMTLSSSLLNSCMAIASSLVILGLGGCVFLRICLILPRSSSAFPFSNCWHTLSICEMYSLTGGSLVVITKLGPWASTFSCGFSQGGLGEVVYPFNFVVVVLVVDSCCWSCCLYCIAWLGLFQLLFQVVALFQMCHFRSWFLPSPPLWLFEQPPVFISNFSNFFICLTMVFWCLLSLILLMNSWHFSNDILV